MISTVSFFSILLFFFLVVFFFFFFNDTATTEIYTLSLHDALPIYLEAQVLRLDALRNGRERQLVPRRRDQLRSEEHTSELQSLAYLVCRLLLEKKKQTHQGQYLHSSSLCQRPH